MMTIDYRFNYLQTVRAHLSVVIYPLQYVVSLPSRTYQWANANFKSHFDLIEINQQLREENLILKVKLQKFEDLRSENARLRDLLDSSVKASERVLIAEILAVDVDPFAQKLKINKGTVHGVFAKQPVLDAQGVMGQVTKANPLDSVVMLITDPDHALPVQIIRTGLQTIAVGLGTVNRLALQYLPNNAGIQVGDLLITSGLGEQFPPGYPVGSIVEVNQDIGQPYAQVQAVPTALLERNREVLLVWPMQQQTAHADAMPAEHPVTESNDAPHLQN